MSDPRIPAALAPAVKGIVSLNDFRPRMMAKRVKRGAGAVPPGTNPAFTLGPSCGFLTGLRDAAPHCEAVMPADLETIYNLNPLYTAGISGKGQTIVVIEDEDAYSLGDWSTFRKAAGLSRAYSSGSISQTHPAPPTGANNCADEPDQSDTTDDEVAIDMEWASAAAPNAAIQVAVCKDSGATFGGLIALENLLNAAGASTTGPAIVSISYGESESQSGATQNAAFNTTYQQGAAEVGMRRSEGWLKRNCLLEAGDRIHYPMQLVERVSQVVVGLRVEGRERERFVKTDDRLFQFACL